ncbi:hypothetical protein BN1708_016628, partial [Verticillium longisporum]
SEIRDLVDPATEQEAERQHELSHKRAVEAMSRITSMNNSNSKMRRHVNIRRCIETFGRHNTDEKARRKEREERRVKKAEQDAKRAAATPVKVTTTKVVVETTPAKLTEADYERHAAAAGISVTKFKRKFERGDVELGPDGQPVVFSKKELKKLRKVEEKADETPSKSDAEGKKKRKHEDAEEATPKKEKKQKKKRQSLGA